MDFSVVPLAAGTSPRRGCRLVDVRPVRVHRISDGHRVPALRSVHARPLSASRLEDGDPASRVMRAGPGGKCDARAGPPTVEKDDPARTSTTNDKKLGPQEGSSGAHGKRQIVLRITSCCSTKAAELVGGIAMRYAKRILVAGAIFSSYSVALAFDKKEIGSTLHHADSSGGSSSKKSTDNGAPAAKPNALTASDSGASGSSTLSSNKDITITSNKDITITNSVGNITFHGSAHGLAPLTIKIGRRPHC